MAGYIRTLKVLKITVGKAIRTIICHWCINALNYINNDLTMQICYIFIWIWKHQLVFVDGLFSLNVNSHGQWTHGLLLNIALHRTWLSAVLHSRALQTCRCHNMKMLSALLALCEGNPSMIGGFPDKRPALSSDSELWYFLCYKVSLNKLLIKQLGCQWFRLTSSLEITHWLWQMWL